MNKSAFSIRKVLLIIVVVVSLAFSIMLSVHSTTGYVVSEYVDSAVNTKALVLFLVGVFGAILYLAKFR